MLLKLSATKPCLETISSTSCTLRRAQISQQYRSPKTRLNRPPSACPQFNFWALLMVPVLKLKEYLLLPLLLLLLLLLLLTSRRLTLDLSTLSNKSSERTTPVLSFRLSIPKTQLSGESKRMGNNRYGCKSILHHTRCRKQNGRVTNLCVQLTVQSFSRKTIFRNLASGAQGVGLRMSHVSNCVVL